MEILLRYQSPTFVLEIEGPFGTEEKYRNFGRFKGLNPNYYFEIPIKWALPWIFWRKI
jgi:hypothetical protein